MPLLLHKLNLTQFRGYEALRLDLAGARVVALTGPNGAGKTNILEAASLLVPGKGLRSADLLEMKNRHAGPEDLWAVAAEAESASGIHMRIGTGLDRNSKRRVVRINGKEAKNQNELAPFISAVWVTPQMDRLFTDSASSRRKFFDRLIFAADPDHVTRLNRYDKNLRERLKLLQMDRRADPIWLDGLEQQLAADAISVAAARKELMLRLPQYTAQLYKGGKSSFPLPEISVAGWAEDETGRRPSLDIEDELKARFRKSRALDAAAGRTFEGVHRSDFVVSYGAKQMPAAQSSTGEQKALLVSITLAHALMMQAEKGFVPLLLLDEVAAHLDDSRRDELFGYLATLEGQVWLTGTDAGIFAALKNHAAFFAIEPGRAIPQPKAVS